MFGTFVRNISKAVGNQWTWEWLWTWDPKIVSETLIDTAREQTIKMIYVIAYGHKIVESFLYRAAYGGG